MYVCMYVCIRVCMYVCMYVCIIYTSVYIYMCMCIYVYLHQIDLALCGGNLSFFLVWRCARRRVSHSFQLFSMAVQRDQDLLAPQVLCSLEHDVKTKLVSTPTHFGQRASTCLTFACKVGSPDACFGDLGSRDLVHLTKSQTKKPLCVMGLIWCSPNRVPFNASLCSHSLDLLLVVRA
jgi:hypothetical protein